MQDEEDNVVIHKHEHEYDIGCGVFILSIVVLIVIYGIAELAIKQGWTLQ